MPRLIKNLEIFDVSSVDKAANGLSRVLLIKRDNTEESEMLEVLKGESPAARSAAVKDKIAAVRRAGVKLDDAFNPVHKHFDRELATLIDAVQVIEKAAPKPKAIPDKGDGASKFVSEYRTKNPKATRSAALDAYFATPEGKAARAADARA